MAYIPNREPMSAWTRLILKYHIYSGSLSHVLHRITGVGLVVWLFMHIWALSSLTQGKAAFMDEMQTLSSWEFKVGEWLVGVLVMFHAFNGIRIAIVDLGQGARYQKKLLGFVYVVAVLVVAGMFMLIFSPQLFAK